MKLSNIYRNKQCPHQPRYTCDNIQCTKFISCMMNEIDALHAIGGITEEEADMLDGELVKCVRK